MRIAGIDLSPKGTGVTIFEGNTLVDFLFFTNVKKWKKLVPNNCCVLDKVKAGDENARIRRVLAVSNEVRSILETYGIKDISLEDYSYQKSSSAYQIAELGGHLRSILFVNSYRVRTHDPKSVKLFFANNGNATKLDMIISLALDIERMKIIIPDNNIGKQFNLIFDDYMENHYSKAPQKPTDHPLEGITDSIALAQMFYKELDYRAGRLVLTGEPESTIRVFQRVTKAVPTCLIDRPFLSRNEG